MVVDSRDATIDTDIHAAQMELPEADGKVWALCLYVIGGKPKGFRDEEGKVQKSCRKSSYKKQ